MAATLNPGERGDHPAPSGVLPGDVLFGYGRRVQCPEAKGSTAARGSRALRSRPRPFCSELAHNPTGAAYTPAPTSGLCRPAAASSPLLGVLTDDMYEKLVYDDFVLTTPAQVEPRLYDRPLTMNGGRRPTT